MTDRRRITRQGIGPAVPLTDADLDDLSVVKPRDVSAAEALWDRLCPPEFRGLLSAEPREPSVG